MQKNFLNIVTLLIAIIALPVTIFSLQQRQNVTQQAQGGTEVYLVPNVREASTGQLLAVAVDMRTGADAVNAVQLDLRYPANKLDVTRVDTDNSAFSSQTEYMAGNGLIRMGREATTPVAGKKHIATVHFSAKDTVTEEEVNQISGNASFNTLTNTSIQANTTLISSTEEVSQKPLGIIEQVLQFLKNLNPFK